MKNTFFFEKHPPLGKQLIAGVSYLAGFDGNYTFQKIGSEYTEVRNTFNDFLKFKNLIILECSNILASFCTCIMWKFSCASNL